MINFIIMIIQLKKKQEVLLLIKSLVMVYRKILYKIINYSKWKFKEITQIFN
jgi:hypothetical protein